MKAVPAQAGQSHERVATGETGAPAVRLHQQLQGRLVLASLCLAMAFLAQSTLIQLPGDAWTLTTMLGMTLVPWIAICLLLRNGLPHHPHAAFGAANTLTLFRAVGTVLLAGWIPVAAQLTQPALVWISLFSVLLLTLDGLDGYLARRTGLASAYGARFDMEIDALLTLIISLLVWQSGEAGIWIVTLGLMRYLFVLAATLQPELKKPLYPSFRRKLICVIQLGTLCAMLSPWIPSQWSVSLGVTACLLLVASFARDTHWLLTRHRAA